MTRRTNKAGLDLIKEHEGLRLTGYFCPAGVPTIGYGHTGPDVKVGQVIKESTADALLELDLHNAEEDVERMATVPLTDNQFAALVSFVFNLGSGNFRRSTLLQKLNDGGYSSVPAELARWNQGGGRVLPGLVARRAAEGVLWEKPA